MTTPLNKRKDCYIDKTNIFMTKLLYAKYIQYIFLHLYLKTYFVIQTKLQLIKNYEYFALIMQHESKLSMFFK